MEFSAASGYTTRRKDCHPLGMGLGIIRLEENRVMHEREGDLWRAVLGDSNALWSTTVPHMTVNASCTESTSFGRPCRYVESVLRRTMLHRHPNIIMWRPWRALRMS